MKVSSPALTIMFRENVLIALTILVTILALSYVILLTVYMHIHEMEQIMKRTEKQEEDIRIQDEMNKPANMVQVDEALARIAIGKSYIATSNPMNHGFNAVKKISKYFKNVS